jgi:hypothetical protein
MRFREKSTSSAAREEDRVARCVWIGVLSAIAGSFLVSPLLALVYKFPIPFSGMESGPSAAVRSLFAVAFYGVFGGFVVLGVLGAAAGVVASIAAGADRHRAWKLALAFGLAADSAAAGALYVADLISPGM